MAAQSPSATGTPVTNGATAAASAIVIVMAVPG